MEGKPLAFGQLSVELLALLPAPDRSGQLVDRNCFGPHSACPFDVSSAACRRAPCALLNFREIEMPITSKAEICVRRYVFRAVTTPMPSKIWTREEFPFSSRS